MAQIVQGLHGVYIDLHALLAQKVQQLLVPAAPLMSGHIKGNNPQSSEFFKRRIERGALLSVLIHYFSSQSYNKTKYDARTRGQTTTFNKCSTNIGKITLYVNKKPIKLRGISIQKTILFPVKV
jgi:hypothetical protein